MVAGLPRKSGKSRRTFPFWNVCLIFYNGVNDKMPLYEILTNHFFHHYQPIYDIRSGKIVGYEGLFRTNDSLNPEIIFQRAKQLKLLYELDSRSIHEASVTYINAGYASRDERLFLNVFPSTLLHPSFHTLINQIIHKKGLSSRQIIFEINENEITDFERLKKEIFMLRNQGFRFAIDDLGKGNSTIQYIIEFNPDVVKLDKYFMIDFTNSLQKQTVVKYIFQYCEKFAIDLIVEGVEDHKSLALLKEMGIGYAQGYLLGKPALLPSPEA